MIETVESRQEFEKRRERAREAMKSALRGELPLSSEENLSAVPAVAEPKVSKSVKSDSKASGEAREAAKHVVRLDSSNSRGSTQNPCPVCEERKRKSRERVKRYREKKR